MNMHAIAYATSTKPLSPPDFEALSSKPIDGLADEEKGVADPTHKLAAGSGWPMSEVPQKRSAKTKSQTQAKISLNTSKIEKALANEIVPPADDPLTPVPNSKSECFEKVLGKAIAETELEIADWDDPNTPPSTITELDWVKNLELREETPPDHSISTRAWLVAIFITAVTASGTFLALTGIPAEIRGLGVTPVLAKPQVSNTQAKALLKDGKRLPAAPIFDGGVKKQGRL